MPTKFKRLISTTLAMVMIFSLFSSSIVQAASVEAGTENESKTIRTELTFLEGTPGDNHLVYTYLEKGNNIKLSKMLMTIL